MRRIASILLALVLASISFAVNAMPAAAEGDGESLDDLQARLEALVEDYPVAGEYAVAVTDLQTGETIAVNGDRPQLAACSINLMVILQATLDVRAGRLEQAPIDNLIARTVYSSNPVTGRELYSLVGRGDVVRGLRRVTTLMKRAGVEDSVLDHPPGYGRESLKVNPNNWLTARDTNRALEWLWEADELGVPWRDHLLDLMTGVKPGLNYLTAIVPAVVSHKNGFFPALDGTYVDNDVAIVRFEHGGHHFAYAISFFSQWVPRKYDDIPLGQRVVSEVWDFFEARYAQP